MLQLNLSRRDFLALTMVGLLGRATLADSCSYCQRGGTLTAHSDGRVFCSSCINSNVFNEMRANQLRGECINFLTLKLGASFPAVPMVMQDRPEFEKLRIRFRLGPTITGIFGHREQTVFILSGLKPANFQGLLVHEYTHAWQQIACPRQELALHEGFASLMQYRWHLDRGESSIAKSHLDNPDPNYGASLKALLAAEKASGFFPLLDKVQRCRKMAEVLANS